MEANDLENAIKSAKETVPEVSKESKISPEEEIGFHKGALNVLIAERNELVKMISTVESIMSAHISRLKELGVDIK